jgi:hypothetical protein
MNPKDKKNFRQIADVVKTGLALKTPYSIDSIKKLIEDNGIRVQNMGSVMQELGKKRYVEHLTDGNYMRNR